MYGINLAQVEGNLTRDPEMKALPSGSNVTTFSIATNRKWNDKDGKLQEEVQYHNITVWGKQAESCAKYLTKGSSAYIAGRLETRSWEKDGVKQYRTEIVAHDVRFGAKPTTQKVGDTSVDYPAEEINPADIPFN
jgi:single-strand DNA-binding protein